jgi:predicted AlkP superfamily pyrophosphatase or phosphodiesterase
VRLRRGIAGAALAALLACICAPVMSAASSPAASGGTNAPEHLGKPSLVLVSIDGFRWDFAERFGAGNIRSIGKRGFKAEALQPAFPTLTFPNHFAIATGVLPGRHGLVANVFPHENGADWYDYKDRSAVEDGAWYLAEPIWVTAEKQGMVTAAYFFVGTEADVGGIRPSRWRSFDPDHDGAQRVRQVLQWLAEPVVTRPRLITLYFEDVDDETHDHGVGSEESIEAIRRVDGFIGQLIEGIDALPHDHQVYLLLVSDHGQASYDPGKRVLVLDEIVDLSGMRLVEGGPYVYVHMEDPNDDRATAMRDAINAAWDCGRAMLPGDTPRDWRVETSPRFPDLIVQADPGCGVISSESMRHKITPGDHGWAPDMPEMRGIFYAMGPGIRTGTGVGVIEVTEIYPLMLEILGLPGQKGESRYHPAIIPATSINSSKSALE